MRKNLSSFQKFAGLLFIITILFSLSSPVEVNAQESNPFLTTVAVQPNYDLKTQQDQLGSARVQAVSLKADVLAQVQKNLTEAPQSLTLQLFPDLELDVIFEQQSLSLTETKLLSGIIPDDPAGWIFLAETDGIISADLVYQSTQYQLRQTNGQYYFTEIDQSQFPQEAEPIVPKILPAAKDTPPLDMVYDSGAFIDVLVVYTAAARYYEGGTAAMQRLINLAVTETNAGYAASGVNHRMRLMHTEEVSFSETGFDWRQSLDLLQGESDGYVDNVHVLRDNYGADLVVMIVDNAVYCGIGYLLPVNSPTYDQAGFSIVSRDCATGYYSFGHETGHNMGAHHDRDTCTRPTGIEQGLYDYSYGFIAPDNSFRTIMAYGAPCNYCTRINQWSNPNVLFPLDTGQPTGVLSTASNSADNRMTLNNSAYAVANFRQEVIFSPSDLATSNIKAFSIDLSFKDNSFNETAFKIERSPNGSAWTTINSIPANITSFTDINNIQCNTNYYYRVTAIKDERSSDPSNILMVKSGTCIAPDAPQDPTAIPSLTQVTLRWTDTLGETGYNIQQSPNGTTGWNIIKELPANTTQTVIKNLVKGTAYYFRIQAFNDHGIDLNPPTITVKTHSHAAYLPLMVR